jgi:hypothetical protein
MRHLGPGVDTRANRTSWLIVRAPSFRRRSRPVQPALPLRLVVGYGRLHESAVDAAPRALAMAIPPLL